MSLKYFQYHKTNKYFVQS